MSASASFVGIVTVLYNADDVLPDFFASLAAQEDVRYRLYVIDNSATDSGTRMSRELAARHGVDAECVFNDANVGVARGNNQGIALAQRDGCTHVLLANNDTAFGPRTIALLLEAMQATGSPAATPKIMYHGEPDRIWFAGGTIRAWQLKTTHTGERERDVGQYDHRGPTEYAPTCFMLVERRVFEQVGLMDEQYFVYYDDTDFVWRLNAHGGHVLLVPESVVLHKVSSSTGGSFTPFASYYGHRNRIYFAYKHLHGFKRLAALGWVLGTRVPRLAMLPSASRKASWKGVRDGFRLARETRSAQR